MARTWEAVRQIVGDTPLLIAGDLFHRWNSPPELINFALRMLKGMEVYSIPGQHDLPHHNLNDIQRSSYWTLVEAGALHHVYQVEEFRTKTGENVILWGYPWGRELIKCPNPNSGDEEYHIALVHRYLWKEGRGFEGAAEESNIAGLTQDIRDSYHWLVFGDNHKDFVDSSGYGGVINCGGLMRRTSDEVDRRPKLYELWSDGKVIAKPLPTTGEVFDVPNGEEDEEFDGLMLDTFLEQVGSAAIESMDFEGALKQYFNEGKVKKAVRSIILRAMEG